MKFKKPYKEQIIKCKKNCMWASNVSQNPHCNMVACSQQENTNSDWRGWRGRVLPALARDPCSLMWVAMSEWQPGQEQTAFSDLGCCEGVAALPGQAVCSLTQTAVSQLQLQLRTESPQLPCGASFPGDAQDFVPQSPLSALAGS